MGELFEIAPGTTRVALTRMAQSGEVENRDGRYRLAGSLAQRQTMQDQGRRRPPGNDPDWAGEWEQWIVPGGKRTADERSQLREAADTLRLAELRDGVWMRPANLAPNRWTDAVAVLDGQAERLTCRPADPEALAWRLWDLDGWASGARQLVDEMAQHETSLFDRADFSAIPDAFGLAAQVVRHLFHDPALPSVLLGSAWPGEPLRAAYDAHETKLQVLLRAFFAQAT